MQSVEKGQSCLRGHILADEGNEFTIVDSLSYPHHISKKCRLDCVCFFAGLLSQR